jgi:hypothetical protein
MGWIDGPGGLAGPALFSPDIPVVHFGMDRRHTVWAAPKGRNDPQLTQLGSLFQGDPNDPAQGLTGVPGRRSRAVLPAAMIPAVKMGCAKKPECTH